jgi:hypothetical protein
MDARYDRYLQYVQDTSRPDAREKRLACYRELDGFTCDSIGALVLAVGGNTNVRKWVARAIKDGEIIQRDDGRLVLPAAEPVTEQLTILRAQQILKHVAELTRDYHTLEYNSEMWLALRRINQTCHEPESVPPLEDDPELSPVAAMSEGASEYIDYDNQGDETPKQTEKRLARASGVSKYPWVPGQGE